MKVHATQTAVQGMQKAQQKALDAATSIAENGVNGDVVQDIVDLKVAKHEFSANVKMLQQIDELRQAALRILPTDRDKS
ncbi:MAG: hypothetical protein H6684_06310 [Deltaproteobacteria bacterium]|nr:hypothetical protein [bacterium]MCB9477621.1 hypothetical protein [Deltaproteobacteria bacterium]MCB9478591.1 hypothetical protein [Deltaproteobacteria bacterium]MCB9488325.1 hypothetical protein [Deltaproteobacteria bacterium]